MTKTISIRDVEHIERINKLVTAVPYEVWLTSGTMMLDARSILSLFRLIGKQANVSVRDGVDPQDFNALVDQMRE